MTDIFTLGLKADTSDIDKGADSLDNFADSAEGADKKTGQLRDGINTAGKAIAAFGVTTVAALGTITVAAGNTAREVENLARLSNLTVEEFQRSAFAAKAYGIEQEKLSDILKDTQDKVGDFLTTGGGALVDFFETIAPQVGVTADQFRGLNGKDALQLYISSLEKANVSQSEMVFFLEAIASDATLLQPLLADNGAEFERLANRADELGLVLDELDISNLSDMKMALDELGAISAATSDVIGATLAPFVTDLTQRFNENSIQGMELRDTMLSVVEVGVMMAGIYADAGRVFEITGKSIGAFIFQAVEEFNTFEARLDLAIANYKLFSNKIDEATSEWINELLTDVTEGLNEVVEAFNFFGVLDDVVLEPPEVDLTIFEGSIAELEAEVAELEDNLVQSNDNIANAWQDVLDTMAQPLPSQQFDQWFDNIEKTIRAQRKLQKEVKKTGSTAITTVGKTTKAETDFNRKKASSEISDIKNVLGIAQNAFSERSKARKALNEAEKAFTAVELALSFQKSAANALEAISAAFAAPWPIGFASGAAMIAIMSSLGLFGGGGGGGSGIPSAEELQDTQGTGTVLGSDDKSQSILNAQERLEDLSIDQLAELRGIRNGINAMTSGIEKLATSIVGGVGIGEFEGPTGITSASLGGLFSKTTKTVIDEGIQFVAQSLGQVIDEGIIQAESFFTIKTKKKKFFGLSSSTRTSIETQDLDSTIREEMALIFQHIGDTVLMSAESLGFETVEIVRQTFGGFDFDREDFSDEFRKRFGNMFGSTFETVEVSLEEALSQFQINIGRISFEGLSGEEIQAELQAVFSQQADLIAEFLVPSIAEYQRVDEGLFDTLIRVTEEQAIFNDALAQMGISLSELSNVMQIDIAQSIIELIGGADRFKELTTEFFNEFFTEAEQFDMLTQSLTEAVEGLGLTMFESREDFRAMVEGLDLTTEAGQAMFAALLELTPAMDEYFDTLENNAAQEAAEAERELEAARRAEAEAAREAAAATRELERAASSAFSTLTKAIKAEQAALKDQLKDDVAEIRTNFDAHRDALRDQLNANMEGIEQVFDGRRAAVLARTEQQIGTMERQLELVNGQVSALSSLSNMLGNSISQVVSLGRSQARNIVQGAIEAARRGQSLAGVDVSGAVSTLTNISAGQFGSALEFQKERARTANQLGELKDLTDGQLSVAERNVMLLEQQIETVQRSADRQIEALDMAQELAEEEAQRRFDEEMALLDQRQQDEEDAAQARFDEEMAALDETLENARQQLDALLGIDTSVKTLIEAEALFAEAIQALIENQASAQEAAIADINQNIVKLLPGETTPPIVPIKPGDAFITPVKPNPASLAAAGDFSTGEVLKSIAVSSAKTAKLLDRWDGDGQPEVRNVS